MLTVRETARLMGAPDSFSLPGSYNERYKAMGDAVALPVAQFIGERFLTKIAEAVYNVIRAEDRLNPDDFQPSSKGQVVGLGGGNLKKILKEHGITQQLSAEDGRTSRWG